MLAERLLKMQPNNSGAWAALGRLALFVGKEMGGQRVAGQD